MKVLCTVKRVVDPDAKVKLAGGGKLDLTGVGYLLNPFDELGVEEAVRLKEKGVATEIVAVSVGTADAQKEIRTALAMGADRGILVEVADPAALDALSIARLLAAVVKKEQPRIVLMGKLAVDAENNQVGQMLAELTGYPQGTFACRLEVSGDTAVVSREVDGGTSEVKLRLPCVVTADLRLNQPRYASLPGIMQAKRKPLETVTPAALGVTFEVQVRVLGYELPPARKAGVKVDSVDALIDKLRNEAKLI